MNKLSKNHIQYNILVLEDDYEIAKIIQKTLERNTFCKIEIAHSLKEATLLIRSKPFDLICLDLILPDGNGIEIAKDIKEQANSCTKIIVISQKTDVSDRIDILENRADDYLPKPFLPGELNARVRKLLGLTTSQRLYKDNLQLELDQDSMKIKYLDQNLLLTKTEFLTLRHIFDKNGFAKTESLLKYLSSKQSKRVKKTALIGTVKRLNDKFRRSFGKTLIENKYANGYYIS